MYNPNVLISNFDDLRRRKSYEEKRSIPLRTVATESGLSLATIQRVKSGNLEKIHASTLTALCKYFNVRSIAELVEYQPDAPPPTD